MLKFQFAADLQAPLQKVQHYYIKRELGKFMHAAPMLFSGTTSPVHNAPLLTYDKAAPIESGSQ